MAFPAKSLTASRLGRWLSAHLAERQRLAWWLAVLRLGLFQFGVGAALAPLTGALNRALISDLGVPALGVGILFALHYFVSPIRAVFGYKSDVQRAAGRWRTPYLVFGAMLTYGGLACAPFALILLGRPDRMPFAVAYAICLAIFLAYGIGINIVETIYLALVSDLTPPEERGKVLPVLWVMLVLGTIASSLFVGQFLLEYTPFRLIRVMQGTAVLFVVLTAISLLGKERLRRNGTVDGPIDSVGVRSTLWASVRQLAGHAPLRNLFLVLFLATMAFTTQDVLLEPYGGQVLGMSVSATTQLTALWGVAMLGAIGMAGLWLWRGQAALPLLAVGCALGAAGYGVVSLAGNGAQVGLFQSGIALIGFGRGLFLVGSIALIMAVTERSHAGLFLGLWGVTQALAQGVGTIGGGLTRDLALFQTGSVVLGYTTVFLAATVVLVLTLVLLKALRLGQQLRDARSPWEGLKDLPADQLLS
ncbi:MAG: BCD family MFS transporter [Roseiflexaceae bacterium]|nr:BCD family MFS transporter [Roseiflexaceae bacterium]